MQFAHTRNKKKMMVVGWELTRDVRVFLKTMTLKICKHEAIDMVMQLLFSAENYNAFQVESFYRSNCL